MLKVRKIEFWDIKYMIDQKYSGQKSEYGSFEGAIKIAKAAKNSYNNQSIKETCPKI